MNYPKIIKQFFDNNYKAYTINELIDILEIENNQMDLFNDSLFLLMKDGFLYRNKNGEYIRNYNLLVGIIKNIEGKLFIVTSYNEKYLVDNIRNLKVDDYVYFKIKNSNVIIKNIITKDTLEVSNNDIMYPLHKDPITGEYYVIKNNKRCNVSTNGISAFSGDLVSLESTTSDENKKLSIKDVKHNYGKKVFYYTDFEWKSFENPEVIGVLREKIKGEEGASYLCEIIDCKDNICYIKPLKKLKHLNVRDDIRNYAYDHGFYKEYPEEVSEEIKELPNLDSFSKQVENDIVNDNLNIRKDLTNLTTFTIDPKTAKDLDDAISLEILPNGNYILYVHIADVSHFVPYESNLSNEAKRRTTSCYLGDDVFAMFPEKLSNGLCSLNESGYKYTKTVQIELDSSGNVLNTEIYKSIIKNDKQMDYDTCNQILEEGNIPKDYEQFYKKLLQMQQLSLLLIKKREERGMLEFNQDEYTFLFNEIDGVSGFSKYEHKTANIIIENFMILANNVLAKKASQLQLPYVYRCHLAPSKYKIEKLKKQIDTFSNKNPYIPSIVNPKVYREFLQNMYSNYTEEEANYISNMALISMQRAFSDYENKGHYGLALDNYGFFTSPIRRYADYLNHLVWDEYLLNGPDTYKMNEYKEEIKNITEHLNDRELEVDLLESVVEYNLLYDYATNFREQVLNAKIEFITDKKIYLRTDNKIPGIILLNKDYHFDKDKGILYYEDITYTRGDLLQVMLVLKKEVGMREILFQDTRNLKLENNGISRNLKK